MSEPNGHREHLEQRAAEVRARLEQRLELIDERRHHLAAVARSAARPPLSWLLLAAAGIAATLFVVHRVRSGRARAPRYSNGVRPEKGVLRQGLERAATSLVAVAAQRLGRQGLDRLLAEPAGGPSQPR
jgi:hypothetical protein